MKKPNNRYSRSIAITVALVVVGLAFLGSFYNPAIKNGSLSNLSSLLPSFSGLSLRLPGIGGVSSAASAWSTFEKYRAFAKSHDLAGVKSLSVQLSQVCANPNLQAQCFSLIDNVYAVTNHLKISDFKHIYSDDHEIILFTDYMVAKDNEALGQASFQTVLFFAKEEAGSTKLQGIKFCPEDLADLEPCVDPDIIERAETL